MRVYVLQVLSVVFLRRETHDTFSEEVHFQGTCCCYKYIDAHVPLVASNEQRVSNILLDDALLVILKFSNVTDKENLASSAQVSWLADPYLLII